MAQMIFVNLPVSDLTRSKAFYEALGYRIEPRFSDETAACVVVSEVIYLMILLHDRFQGFSTLPRADTTASTSAIIALSCEDRAAVDRMAEAALAHGGSERKEPTDHGFMYLRTLHDPDGNVLEGFWMDPAAIGDAN